MTIISEPKITTFDEYRNMVLAIGGQEFDAIIWVHPFGVLDRNHQIIESVKFVQATSQGFQGIEPKHHEERWFPWGTPITWYIVDKTHKCDRPQTYLGWDGIEYTLNP